jgi:hypothetical protein
MHQKTIAASHNATLFYSTSSTLGAMSGVSAATKKAEETVKSFLVSQNLPSLREERERLLLELEADSSSSSSSSGSGSSWSQESVARTRRFSDVDTRCAALTEVEDSFNETLDFLVLLRQEGEVKDKEPQVEDKPQQQQQQQQQTQESHFRRELEQQLQALARQVEEMQQERLLGGAMDGMGCYLTVQAGAGGSDAFDWSRMLVEMYVGWARSEGLQVTQIDSAEGPSEAGRYSTPVLFGYLFACHQICTAASRNVSLNCPQNCPQWVSSHSHSTNRVRRGRPLRLRPSQGI